MIIILMIDLFGLGHFFFGGHGGHESNPHHEVSGHVAAESGEKASGEH
jgi:hypothetical protein